jgi:tRNA dimethylallyltransferase
VIELDRESPLPPLLLIVGPTASGKTKLAVEVAERLNGEIISADAVAVYRGLDIGSDKPDTETRRRVPHHLIDVAEPRERFSAGAFVTMAEQAIEEIRARHHTPVVVGGTHFYVRSLLLGLFPAPARDLQVKARLARAWEDRPEAVWRRLEQVDPETASRVGHHDRQRVLRALELFEVTGKPLSQHWQSHRRSPRFRALLVAPDRSRTELYDKIESRVDRMFASGLVAEVHQLLTSGVPCEAHALKAIGYRQVVAALGGEYDLSTAVARTKQSSRKLANRQLGWLKRLREGKLCMVPPVEQRGASVAVTIWEKHRKGCELE